MSKAFDEWWLKSKLPAFKAINTANYSAVRSIAMRAYNAGKREEREVLTARRNYGNTK